MDCFPDYHRRLENAEKYKEEHNVVNVVNHNVVNLTSWYGSL